MGRDCKILLVGFFNSSEKISPKSKFNSAYAAKDRTPVNCPVDRTCITCIPEGKSSRCRPPGRLLEETIAAWTVDRLRFNRTQDFWALPSGRLSCWLQQGAGQSLGRPGLILGENWSVFYSDLEFVFDPNSNLSVSFSLGILCLYIEGYCPYVLYHEIDWLIRSLTFCPEDVGNCWTSLNSYVLFLFFVCLIHTIDDYSLALLFSLARIPTIKLYDKCLQ